MGVLCVVSRMRCVEDIVGSGKEACRSNTTRLSAVVLPACLPACWSTCPPTHLMPSVASNVQSIVHRPSHVALVHNFSPGQPPHIQLAVLPPRCHVALPRCHARGLQVRAGKGRSHQGRQRGQHKKCGCLLTGGQSGRCCCYGDPQQQFPGKDNQGRLHEHPCMHTSTSPCRTSKLRS
jgi:hypothetical protein